MRFIEPIIINQINKDVAPNGLDYSGRRILNPIRDVLNGRYLSSEGSEQFQVESIKGTTEVTSMFTYSELLTNATFQNLLIGWSQIDIGSNEWLWIDNSAYIYPESGDILYQSKELTAGSRITLQYSFIVNTSIVPDLQFKIVFLNGTTVLATQLIAEANSQQTGEKQITVPVNCTGVGFQVTGNCFPFPLSTFFFLKKAQIVGPTVISSLPSGTNICIGSYENLEKNILIYFLYNSNGYHGVYRYVADGDYIDQLMVDDPLNPVLKFSNDPRYMITGVGMIGDILTWTDNNNPQRYVNINRSYGALNEFKLSLIKIGPKNPPTFTIRSSDSNITFNRLQQDSFQFAFQYVYLDNEYSVMSPYSRLCLADLSPDITSTQRAKVFVTHTVDADVIPVLKQVKLLYRKNNDVNWYVWKEVTTIGSTITEYFFNNEQGTVVPATTTGKLFDSIPNRSKALTIFRGRVFLNIEEEGYSFTPPVISASVGSDQVFSTGDVLISSLQTYGAFLKKNGTYLVGVYFRDKFGRLTGVVSKAYVNGKSWLINTAYDANTSPSAVDSLNAYANKVNVTLSGKGLRDGQYFIAITEEQNYSQFMQTPAHIFFYMANGGLSENSTYNLISANVPRFYRRGLGNVFSGFNNSFSYIHFLLPREIPFVPDTDCYVRFASSQVTAVEKVVDVLDGDIVVTGNFGVRDFQEWVNLQKGCRPTPLIEVFKQKSAVDPFFFQVLGPFNVSSDGTLSQTTFSGIEPDTYYAHIRKLTFRDYDLDGMTSFDSLKPQITISPDLFYEMRTPTFKKASGSSILDRPTESNQMYVPDLSKAAWGKGVAVVETTPEILNRSATIRFSDPYIEGSNVNGLNSFPVGNLYDKIGQDRSPITKIIPVGNVLVSVHERNVTTMYIGEGIVRTGETGFITKVDAVVGDDRKLIGDYGSYHPESLQEIDGILLGFDIFSGTIWRYTVEGIYAVSNFGMKNYFKEVAEALFDDKDTLKFVAGIDKYNKEYLITIPTNSRGVESTTWAFNYERNVWTHRYSFVPEMMGRIGTRLLSFKNGRLYKHNESSTYNNFYGVQYQRKIVAACNPQPNRVKVWSALNIAGMNIAADETASGTLKVIEVTNDQGQASYTRAKEFEKKEGVYYGPILKDTNTNPALISAGRNALRDGKDMRSKSLEITINCDRTDRSLLQKINIVGETSEFSI